MPTLRLKSFISLSLVLSLSLSVAQPRLDCEWEVSKKAEKLYEEGKEELLAGHPMAAQTLFLEALQKEERYPQARYYLGEISWRLKKYNIARQHLELAIEDCPDINWETYHHLGMFALQNYDYPLAERYFEKALKLSFEYKADRDETADLLGSTKNLAFLMNNPVPYDPKSVPGISTPGDEYLAIISPDGSQAYYTRRYQKKEKTMLTATYVEEFTRSMKQGDRWMPGETLPFPFNQGDNEGGPSITANNNELYFTVCSPTGNGQNNCDIYWSLRDDGFWTEIRPVENVNLPNAWDSQPSVTANGDVLFFTSNCGDGQGGLDLWRSDRQEDGSWGAPYNLGPKINTPGDEKSPFIHSDSRTLYFASEGHLGFGGFDIFYSQERSDDWDHPKNIGYPINTEQDEVGLFVSLDGATAYFASNELKSIGGWDVYSFNLPTTARPDKVMLLTGNLSDEFSEPVREARIEIKNLETKEIQTFKTDSDGRYAAVVRRPKDEDLIVTVKKEGYAFQSEFIAADEEMEDIEEVNMDIRPIEVGGEYEINDINFATNSFELNTRSRLIVDEFAAFLLENPTVHVSIEGHTDNVGNSSDNMTLSKNRAEAVYLELIEQGVQAVRLDYKGFGSTKPVADNSTESGRAKNRRTVFRILNF
ncbi:MAG: PD40 domain-containing protein [Flavobacteriales bacterium]|nr:PD40 domain-containing protein [Flavobacteriales bacterium]